MSSDPFKPTPKFSALETAAAKYYGRDPGKGVPEPNPEADQFTTRLPPTSGLCDGDLEAIAIDYPDYDETTTFVVSGPLVGTAGATADRPLGTPRTLHEARAWALEKYGPRLMMEIMLPYRWAFRVRRA